MKLFFYYYGFIVIYIMTVCTGMSLTPPIIWPQPIQSEFHDPAFLTLSPYSIALQPCEACEASFTFKDAFHRYFSPGGVLFPFPAARWEIEDNVTRLVVRMPSLADQLHAAAGPLSIGIDGIESPALGMSERYQIVLNASNTLFIEADNVFGVLRAFATLAQLVRYDVDLHVYYLSHQTVWVQDQPSFPWRAMQLDTTRQFLPMAALEHTLDAMSYLKLNVLQIRFFGPFLFPFHLDELIDGSSPPSPSPFYGYSLADLQHLSRLARSRGIQIVPEILLPAGAQAWATPFNLSCPCPPLDVDSPLQAALDPLHPALFPTLDSLCRRLRAVLVASLWSFNTALDPLPCWQAAASPFPLDAAIANFTTGLDALIDRQLLQPLLTLGAFYTNQTTLLPRALLLIDATTPFSAASLSSSLVPLLNRSLGYCRADLWSLDLLSSLPQLFRAATLLRPLDLPTAAPFLGPSLCFSPDAPPLDATTLHAALWPRAAVLAESAWSGPARSRPYSPLARQQLAHLRCRLRALSIPAAPVDTEQCLLPSDIPAAVALHRVSWWVVADPSTLFLFLLVLSLIVLGAHRSWQWELELNHMIANQHVKPREGRALRRGLTPAMAIVLPLLGSVFLIVLFYFLDWLGQLLFLLVCLYALSCGTYVLGPLFAALLPPRTPFAACCRCHCLATLTLDDCCAFLTSAVLLVAWLVWRVWFTTDLLAVVIAISAISLIRISNLVISSIILWLFFFYDIFWVFLSECIFGRNVMVTVAVSLPSLPLLISLPRFTEPSHLSMLGLGDIVLPGIVLSFLYRFDRKSFGTVLTTRGYFAYAMVGYLLGLVTAVSMLPAFQRAQPALLYLVPGVLLPTYLLGFWRKQLPNLWRDQPVSHSSNHPTTEPPHQAIDDDPTRSLLNHDEIDATDETDVIDEIPQADVPNQAIFLESDDHHEI